MESKQLEGTLARGQAKPVNPGIQPFPLVDATLIASLRRRVRPDDLQAGIRWLCTAPLTGEEFEILLVKDRLYLRNKYRIRMLSEGLRRVRYPKSTKRPR